jgi:hypothetical protein
MKPTIKLKIKATKPRNPVALPARQRKAGAHQAYNPTRHARRVQKHALRLVLLGRDKDGDMDA